MQEGVEVSAAPLPRRHDEIRAVGGEPGVEHRGHPRRQVTPRRRRPEQHGRRAVDPHELGDDPAMRLGAIVGERLVVGDEHDVHPVTDQLIDGRAEVIAGNDGTDAAPERGGQVGGLRQQLERHPRRLAVVQLAHDPHARLAVIRRGRRTVAASSRFVAGPGSAGRRGEGPGIGEDSHEPVIREPVGSHESTGSFGKWRRLHVRHLGGRRGEAHGGAVEPELAGIEPLDGGRLGPPATDHGRVPRCERGLGDGDHRGQRQTEPLEPALDDPSGDETRPVERQGLTARRLGPTQPGGDLRSDLTGFAIERGDAAQHEIDATEPSDGGGKGIGGSPRVRAGQHPIAQQHRPGCAERHRLAECRLRAGRTHRQRPHLVGQVQRRLERMEVRGVGDRGSRLPVDRAVGSHRDRRPPEIGHLLDQHDRPHVACLVTQSWLWGRADGPRLSKRRTFDPGLARRFHLTIAS
jgi:hypothetical protein